MPELQLAAQPEAGPAPEVPPPPQPANPLQGIQQLMQLATEHEQANRLDAAESVLRHVLAEAGDHPPALHLMGIVKFKQERIE